MGKVAVHLPQYPHWPTEDTLFEKGIGDSLKQSASIRRIDRQIWSLPRAAQMMIALSCFLWFGIIYFIRFLF